VKIRWFTRISGIALMLAALASLASPLSLQVVDRSGERISCGNGFHISPDVAAGEDVLNRQLYDSHGPPYQTTDYVAECGALISAKRVPAGWVGAFGAILLVTTLFGVNRRLSRIFDSVAMSDESAATRRAAKGPRTQRASAKTQSAPIRVGGHNAPLASQALRTPSP